MGELPHLKALVERHADQPFAVVGINTDGDKQEYLRLAEKHGVTWRSAWQGSTSGPIPTEWGVTSYPTVFVLDAQHRIRFVNARGARLGQVVDELLGELANENESSSGETEAGEG